MIATDVTIETIGFRATSRDTGGFLNQLAQRSRGTSTEIP